MQQQTTTGQPMRDTKPPAVIVQHPSAPVPQLEPDVTVADVERSKAEQARERAEAIAHLLANFAGVSWTTLDTSQRDNFMKWGWIAVRGSSLHVADIAAHLVGLHAAAQAIHERERYLDHDFAIDLLNHEPDRKRCMQMAMAGIDAYLKHMGKVNDKHNDALYGRRMGVTE